MTFGQASPLTLGTTQGLERFTVTRMALGIADQVDGLALGQLHFQGGMAPAAMQGGAPASQPMENDGMHANAATGMVDEDAVGPQEETIQPTLRDTGFLFAGDSPLEDVD